MVSGKQVVQALILIILDAFIMTWPLTGETLQENILISAGKYTLSGLSAVVLVWLIKRGHEEE